MCGVTMGHLRVTVGHISVVVGHLRVTIGRVSALYFFLISKLIMGHFDTYPY